MKTRNPRKKIWKKKSSLQSSSLYNKPVSTPAEEVPKESDLGITEHGYFSAFEDPNIKKIKGKIQQYFAEKRGSVPFDELTFHGEVKAEVTGFNESYYELYLTTDPSKIDTTKNEATGQFKIVMDHSIFPPALRKKIGGIKLELNNEFQKLMGRESPVAGDCQLDLTGDKFLGYAINYSASLAPDTQAQPKPDTKEEPSETSKPIQQYHLQTKGTLLKYNLLVRGSLGDAPLDELFEKDFPIKDQYVIFNIVAPVVYDQIHRRPYLEQDNRQHDLSNTDIDPGICLVM